MDFDEAPENLKQELTAFCATTSSATDCESLSRAFLPATKKQVSRNTKVCKKLSNLLDSINLCKQTF